MRPVQAILVLTMLCAGRLPCRSTSAQSTESQAPSWSFSASVFTFAPPQTDVYAQPTLTADHAWLHLEARYNSEALETGSVWIGYDLAGGDEIKWQVTPILGGVFGNLNGIAPGCEATFHWHRFEFDVSAEYVFDLGDSQGSYFYNWTELRFWPTTWLRFGLAAQRTHVYETNREVQPGLLAGFAWRQLDFAGYVFDPDTGNPTWVVAVGLDF